MSTERILIVDDEERIRDLIREYFSLEGFITDEASDGIEALEIFEKNRFSLVILDIMMPKLDGWSVCREIRKISDLPVVMLTARGEEYDKLFAFELGVDDYIVKPFSPKELLARTKAILRRSAFNRKNINKDGFKYKGLIIEFNSRNVYVDGKPASLTPKEYDLLKFLVQNPNQVFSREQLLNSIWGYDFTGDDRTVDTHVKMLRECLGPYRKLIVTVWGIGYKLETGEDL